MTVFPGSSLSLSNIEQLTFSTFRIEVETKNDTAFATCFFVQFKLPNGNNAVLAISSRHVLNGAINVRISIPVERCGGRLPEYFANITVKLNGKIICHPSPDIDLAGFIIHHIENSDLPEGDKFYYRAISEINIPTFEDWDDINLGDEVFAIGCPHGLEDERNKRPLVRKGVIALLPKELERPFLYIDMPTHGGSSGSPVIIDSFFSYNRVNSSYELRSRFYLIGVISSGLELQDSDAGTEDKFLADLHLGKLVRSDKINEMINEFFKQNKMI